MKVSVGQLMTKWRRQRKELEDLRGEYYKLFRRTMEIIKDSKRSLNLRVTYTHHRKPNIHIIIIPEE